MQRKCAWGLGFGLHISHFLWGHFPNLATLLAKAFPGARPQTSLFNWIPFLLELCRGKHFFLCCGNVAGGFIHIINLGRISSPARDTGTGQQGLSLQRLCPGWAFTALTVEYFQ